MAWDDGSVCSGLAWLTKEGGERWERMVREERGGGIAAAVGGRMARIRISNVGITWVGNATGNEIGESETAEESLEMASG